MVKVLSSVALLASLAICTIAAPPVTRDVTVVNGDLVSINTQLDILQPQLSAFNGAITQALAINTEVANIGKLLDKTQTDVLNTAHPVSESDGQSVFGVVDVFEPKILAVLTVLSSKQPAFVALDKILGGSYKQACQNIRTLHIKNDAVASALIAIAPADLVAKATQAKVQVDAAFAKTEGVYTNCGF